MHDAIRRLAVTLTLILGGQAWFLRAAEPVPQARVDIDPATVERHGSGWRRPQAGWLVLHIEGKPYERGYQHGRLLAREIQEFLADLALYRGPGSPADAWHKMRLMADAMFLRRYGPELLEEMKGIADGASAAGARHDGRPIDLVDIVALNSDIEIAFLDAALSATPHGLEGRKFADPPRKPELPEPETHCSAFAATGPATADGKIVIGHITMWNLFHATHYNVWLDVKPEHGHRVMMQTYPGGVMSGLDYYQNDAGVVVCETTIAQTSFDPEGTPLPDRIRRAVQYGESIDQVVSILKTGNNGLYSNEWLIADAKTNEIAMFELGTRKTRLWRSSKEEWFGGTRGFYWGCNNAKDLEVRLESVGALGDRPANVVFHPSDRDRKWLELFDQASGKIDAGFGFKAFTTTPLAAAHSLDAKFTTAAMALRMESWARFGPPLGKAWLPSQFERERYPTIEPLIGEDWTILRPDAPLGTQSKSSRPVDLALQPRDRSGGGRPMRSGQPVWRGTILPEKPGDAWLAAAFADYEHLIAGGTAAGREELQLFGPASRYLTALVRRQGKDLPLLDTPFDLRSDAWYEIAAGKGVLIMAEIRKLLGAKKFAAMMDDFGASHAGRKVTSESFFAAVEKAYGQPLGTRKDAWTSEDPVPHLPKWIAARQKTGRIWAVDSFEHDIDQTVIVYGTKAESDAQREAAFELSRLIAARWSNHAIPVKPETEASDSELAANHVLIVGRPATSALAERFARNLPVQFGPASVAVAGSLYADTRTALAIAGPNPLSRARSIVLFTGLGAKSTWHAPAHLVSGRGQPAEILILESGRSVHALVAPVAGPAIAARPAQAQTGG